MIGSRVIGSLGKGRMGQGSGGTERLGGVLIRRNGAESGGKDGTGPSAEGWRLSGAGVIEVWGQGVFPARGEFGERALWDEAGVGAMEGEIAECE